VRAAFVWSRYQPAVARPRGGLDSCSSKTFGSAGWSKEIYHGRKARVLQKRWFVLGWRRFNDAFSTLFVMTGRKPVLLWIHRTSRLSSWSFSVFQRTQIRISTRTLFWLRYFCCYTKSLQENALIIPQIRLPPFLLHSSQFIIL
jgi:hypothetical protein